jgi:hypothetical protein
MGTQSAARERTADRGNRPTAANHATMRRPNRVFEMPCGKIPQKVRKNPQMKFPIYWISVSQAVPTLFTLLSSTPLARFNAAR